MSNITMDQILDALDQSHQRATYGAVAALLGIPPRTLMQGRERDQRHSWVVNRKNGEPTGYTPDQLHPALLERADVLSTKEDLAAWLRSALVEVGTT
jgi:alkylated DNA nucleotide flippase Atl1